ncbi:MAG TPA: hypothetical protein VGO93_30045 [Candidatus Xenobia bacterium]
MALGTIGGIGSLFGTQGTGATGGGSSNSLISSLHDKIFGPKLKPDDPAPPIDRDEQLDPNLFIKQWPPQGDTTGADATPSDAGSPAPQTPPQGMIPCEYTLSSADPQQETTCIAQLPGTGDSATGPDQVAVPCAQVVTQGDNSYCKPDMSQIGN